jgi:3-oxoacyl-[acyl-carrier-protein] synthase II
MSRRVVITGIGLLTPLGVGVEPTWSALLEGTSAVGPIAAYDASSLRTQLGAEVAELTAKEYVSRRHLRTMTRYDVMAGVAAELAVRDRGAELPDDPEGRHALFAASNKEISEPEHFEEVAVAVRDEHGDVDMRRFGEDYASSVHPLFFIEGIQGASLFYISETYGMHGANTYFAGTAEAGLIAIGRGFRAVKRGEAEIALAGGGDAPVCWWNMAKIDSLGVTSASNVRGGAACRPFDRERDGAVMGEGGAFLVLEELEAARARGARMYAEVVGFGAGSDTAHLITPDPSGAPLVRAIDSALGEAGLDAADVGYVAAHGSGTVLGDASEARALSAVFDGPGPAVSSVKPASGHLVAAAGALNAAVAALAVHHGALPATLNLQHPDPVAARIDLISGDAREARVAHALALARGFEGQNVALALSAL